MKNYVPLGKVGRPFGVRGDLRVTPLNRLTTWFDSAEGVWIREEDGGPEPEYFKVLAARRHKNQIVLALEGIRDRNAAESLRGREVVAPEEALEPLEEGEYYWYQLIGLAVETDSGRSLGEVIRMEETAPELGGADLFVVAGTEGEILIPVAESSVAAIDLEARKLVVYEVPGLTDN